MSMRIDVCGICAGVGHLADACPYHHHAKDTSNEIDFLSRDDLKQRLYEEAAITYRLKCTTDIYGLALMMIAESCDDPVGVARAAIAKARGEPTT
jgi:hypothetical protein